jgi:hypothetical protein
MSSVSTGHLTDDQFAECAAMEPSAASEAHLLECAQCRQELIGFTASIDEFSRAAFGWSEAQPSVSLRAAARPRASDWYAPAGWALAAGLVLAACVPFALHRDRHPNAPAETALSDAPDDSDAQIAEDNRLMQSVNMAIGSNDPSMLREYGLQTTRHARLKTVSGLRSE